MAVSGGADSMVLLDLLSKRKDLELVVAHFDHGIRDNDAVDEHLVRSVAAKLKLPVEVGYGKLPKTTSEAKARDERYKFLFEVVKKHKADGVITAHHQDDLLETAVINLLRGSGWRGMVAIIHNDKIRRPLLVTTKTEILAYARSRKLKWNEDETNLDLKYLRNRVRAQIIPRLKTSDRKQLLGIIYGLAENAPHINKDLGSMSKKLHKNGLIDRRLFASLPMAIGNELILEWLRLNKIDEVDRPLIERLGTMIKSAKAGTKHDIDGKLWLVVDKLSSKIIPVI